MQVANRRAGPSEDTACRWQLPGVHRRPQAVRIHQAPACPRPGVTVPGRRVKSDCLSCSPFKCPSPLSIGANRLLLWLHFIKGLARFLMQTGALRQSPSCICELTASFLKGFIN